MPGRGLRVRPEKLRVYYPLDEDVVFLLEIENQECVRVAVKIRSTTTGVAFSDVFFSVAPGEVKTLTVFFSKCLIRRKGDHLTLCVAPMPSSAGENQNVEQLWNLLQKWSEIEVPITYVNSEKKTRSKPRHAREKVDHAKKKKKSAKPQRPLLFMEKVRLIKQREAKNQKKKNTDKEPKA